jgi:outer membrane protein assembly factor BamB
MNTTTRFAFVLSAFALILTGSALASDWPGFRGSHGGVAEGKDLPVRLTSDNILWKIKLPGAGTSSPITTGDKIFLTGNAGYGTSISKGMGGGFGGGGGFPKKGGFPGKGGFGKGDADQQKLKLLVLCIDRAKGDVVWTKEIQPKLPETNFTGMMREHSYASSTPVTDGKTVYAFFGKSGVHAFDLEGKKLWSADVGSSTHMWGSASSPVLHENLLIVNAAIESKSLIALDKNTGKEVWRKGGLGTSWASPIVVKNKEGKHEVILNVPGKIMAHDVETGKELWTCQGVVGAGGGGGGGFGGGGFGGGSYTASTPVARDGIVYVIGGGGPTPATAIAVKTGGKGDVSKTHVLWRAKAGATNCSPVLVAEHLCWVDGTLTCLKLSDGSVAMKERLYDGKNEYVSAVAVGDKVYALTRYSGLFVVSAGAKYERSTPLNFKGDDSVFNASPAVSDGRLYLRSNEYLYCLGKK